MTQNALKNILPQQTFSSVNHISGDTQAGNAPAVVVNILSTLLLRVASRVSFVLLGFYLGSHISSATMVAFILESFYLSELALSPIAGALSDRWGRKPFLLFAPFLGALASLFLFLGTIYYPHPDVSQIDFHLISLFVLILIGRLLEGATTALNTPACLGHISDSTYHSTRWRTRAMTAFEVATVGGLALAIPLGGQIGSWFGTYGFLIVIGLHMLNLGMIALFIVERPWAQRAEKNRVTLKSYQILLRDRSMLSFFPAWLAINTIVGGWISLAVLMLTYPDPAAELRHPDQLLYGGFSKGSATMIVGCFGLTFLLGMFLWMFFLPRMRRTTIMLIGLVGLALCVLVLAVINNQGSDVMHLSASAHQHIWLLLPFLAMSFVLLSGFTPAALTQIVSASDGHPEVKGMAMGVYSVLLGLGQFLGALIGGFCIDQAGCYGLILFSIGFGLLALVSVLSMRWLEREHPEV